MTFELSIKDKGNLDRDFPYLRNYIYLDSAQSSFIPKKVGFLCMGLGITTRPIPIAKYSNYPDTQPILNTQYPRN